MSSSAVVAEGLSKLYRIGEYKAGYETLRDSMADAARRLRHRDRRDTSVTELWALDDVSFEVRTGEVVGFIGHNGAGKSTLLKILTRITPPTRGTATISGRVGSILEVGTGFHPELTGRENVLLNGAVLGMSRREVLTKFDEIVEFSGIGKFIDTPVKRYSSGMYVRLAFAVAAHLEPEVLIIDEVLAVGDHEFQQRCMGRIEDISSSGRTVLFVSHDMQAVSRLCDRAYWLEKGRVMLEGPSESVVAQYLQGRSGSGAERSWPLEEAPGSEHGRVVRTRVVDEEGHTRSAVDVQERVGIEIEWVVTTSAPAPTFPKIKLTNQRSEVIFNALDTDERWDAITRPGRYVSTAWIPGNLLNEGFTTVDVAVVSLGGAKLQHVDGDLWLGMMGGSVKGRDLRRDPRFALHSGSEDPPGWRGDAKVAGRGVEVVDLDVVERVLGAEHAAEGADLFRLEVTELVVVRLGEPADHLVIESWHEGRGTTRLERR